MPVNNFHFFLSMLKNAGSLKLNRDLIGYATETPLGIVSYEDILAYAAATRDTNPIYAQNGVAPPLFLTSLIIPTMKDLWCHPSLKLNLLRMVYAQQEIVWHQPIRSGDDLSLKMIIDDITDTPAGELIEVSALCYRDNALLAEGKTGMIVRKKKRRPKRRPPEKPAPEEQFRVEIKTDDGQELAYAKASGDNNFIHTSHFLARLAGLPRTILHGSCALSVYCWALTQSLADNDITQLSKIKGRFAAPVFPGDALTLVGYGSPVPSEVPFEVLSSSGGKVFTHGLLTLKTPIDDQPEKHDPVRAF